MANTGNAGHEAVRTRALDDLRRFDVVMEGLGTVQIVDRCEALVTLDVPNVALIEYKAPPNFAAATCPMCAANVPITTF